MAGVTASADGSLAGFASLDAMLEQHLPAAQLAEARRVLYGASRRGARGGSGAAQGQRQT